MYSSLWSPELRQGDIVGEIFLPTIGTNFQSIVGGTSLTGATEKQQHERVIIGGDYHYLVIVSHCCEFNEGKRNKFLVARLQRPRQNLSSEQYEALRLSNDVEARASSGEPVAGLDSFLLDPVPGSLDEERVASFTSITAVPLSMKEDFRAAKIAELDHGTRILFRAKLAWFFGRTADDIPDAEKAPAKLERADLLRETPGATSSTR
ncbi:MAG TPA: hypothetical protein VHQ43_10135 [Solirubrobacterales bacterium]|nr:hypothetical protein [Solirubrobacterales bacterium]